MHAMIEYSLEPPALPASSLCIGRRSRSLFHDVLDIPNSDCRTPNSSTLSSHLVILIRGYCQQAVDQDRKMTTHT